MLRAYSRGCWKVSWLEVLVIEIPVCWLLGAPKDLLALNLDFLTFLALRGYSRLESQFFAFLYGRRTKNYTVFTDKHYSRVFANDSVSCKKISTIYNNN